MYTNGNLTMNALPVGESMSIIRRAQAAAATADRMRQALPAECCLPARHQRVLDDMSGSTAGELEDACTAVEFLAALANLDVSDPDGR